MPNRIAVYFTALAALCAGLAPVVANLDLESTVGVIGGVGALSLVVSVWLNGWQKYEERVDLLDIAPGLPDVPHADQPGPDVGDAGATR